MEDETDTKNESNYLSVIGTSYLFPIAALLEKLESSESKGPNEVQESPYRNGFSVAIVVLTVFLIESFINRTKTLLNEKENETADNKREHMADYFKRMFPDAGMVKELEELFVIRDVIAHNYIWTSSIKDNEGMLMHQSEPMLNKEYGRNRFFRAVDDSGRVTMKLKLNLFPTRICREDVVKVLQCACGVLLYLESQDRRYCYISRQYVSFRDEPISFTKLVDSL